MSRSTVRRARAIRCIPTSSASMLLDTSSATMMSTPSEVTSCRRAPILGSSMPIKAAASAVRHNKNRQTLRTGRSLGNMPSNIRLSSRVFTILRCQL